MGEERVTAPVGYMDYLTELGSSSESFCSPIISESCPVIHLCLYLCIIYSGETFVCTVILERPLALFMTLGAVIRLLCDLDEIDGGN